MKVSDKVWVEWIDGDFGDYRIPAEVVKIIDSKNVVLRFEKCWQENGLHEYETWAIKDIGGMDETYWDGLIVGFKEEG